MPTIRYSDVNLSRKTIVTIDAANAIIKEYTSAGYELTLRQLYYQFVARGLIENNMKEYKRLGDAINSGRLAGMIDWDHITDRTRNLRSLSHWADPAAIIASAAASYRIDKWATQEWRCEVWIEKDALLGVLDGVCPGLDVPYFSCRGYVSQSEMWGAAQRLRRHERSGQKTIIFHLGDHDPSGVDMSRDIAERLAMFGSICQVGRIALTKLQVDRYNPPPNPAKLTDARAEAYIDKYGDDSWELDALDPATLTALIEEHVGEKRDIGAWTHAVEQEAQGREQLENVRGRWDDVIELLDENTLDNDEG